MDRDGMPEASRSEAELQRYRQAVAEWEERLANDPTDYKTYMRLGDLHLKMGRYVEGMTVLARGAPHYTRFYSGTKGFFHCLILYELMQSHAPDLERDFNDVLLFVVKHYFEAFFARDARDESWNVAMHWSEGRGRDHDAIEALEKIVELRPDGLSSLALVEALLRVGDIDHAIERFVVAAHLLVRSKVGSAEDIPRRLLRLMLLRLLRARFGTISAPMVARVKAAATEQLGRWAQQLPMAGDLDGLMWGGQPSQGSSGDAR